MKMKKIVPVYTYYYSTNFVNIIKKCELYVSVESYTHKLIVYTGSLHIHAANDFKAC